MGRERDEERGKLTFSERDRMRREGGERPRGKAAHERATRERQSALGEAESLFDGDPGGAAGADLANAVREAHGTPGLEAACRAYFEALGAPSQVELLAIFLDSRAVDLMVPCLEALEALASKGRVQIVGSLRVQLRALTQHADDDVAGIAEDLLG